MRSIRAIAKKEFIQKWRDRPFCISDSMIQLIRMPDPAEQLRAQIRTLQAQRRSLESKLMQPQSMLRASLLERFLRAGGAVPTCAARHGEAPQELRPGQFDARCHSPARRDLPGGAHGLSDPHRELAGAA